MEVSVESRIDHIVNVLETGDEDKYRRENSEKAQAFDAGSRDPNYNAPGLVERHFPHAHNFEQSHYAAGMALSRSLDRMGGMAPVIPLADELGEASANGYVNPLLYKRTLENLAVHSATDKREVFTSFAQAHVRKENELAEEFGD